MEREEIKQKIYELAAGSHKKMKPGDLAKTMARSLGLDKKLVKEAINELVAEGRLVYSYAGHSWLEVPADD